MRQGLSQSVPTRIRRIARWSGSCCSTSAIPMRSRTAASSTRRLLDEADFAMNRAAFAENGYSKGMFYNTYCNARVTLVRRTRLRLRRPRHAEQQRAVQGQHLRPEHARPGSSEPSRARCRTGARIRSARQLFAGNPNAQFYPNCDPRDQQSTQPSEPSDQKYARWYPSAIPLPNDTVLVVGGFDQDNSVPPDPDRVAKGKLNQSQSDTAFTASGSIRSSRRSTTRKPIGTSRWRTPAWPSRCTRSSRSSRPARGRTTGRCARSTARSNYGDELIPGGARFGVGGGTPPFTKGTTWCLDVLGRAEGSQPATSPRRTTGRSSTPPWKSGPYCCPTASLLEIDGDGQTVSHKWFMISGHEGRRSDRDGREHRIHGCRPRDGRRWATSCSRLPRPKPCCCPTERCSSVRA